MKESNSTNLCARAEDLVTYLYGEASRAELKDFEQHLQLCASCRTELATFGYTRKAMGEWRQQALGIIAAPYFGTDAARANAPAQGVRKRSALAALREFFTLSPAWMRAATAGFALLFCALAAIAVAYFVRPSQTNIVEKQVNSGYSQQEVEAKIAAAIKKHDEVQMKEKIVSSPEDVTPAGNERKTQPLFRRNDSGSSQVAKANRKQPSTTRTRMRPSVELVATDYLPFTASSDDEHLPALTDLVDDAN